MARKCRYYSGLFYISAGNTKEYAFSSNQRDSHVPVEKISQHAGQHIVLLHRNLPHVVMIHPKVRFGLLKALLARPMRSREPDEVVQVGGAICVRYEIRINSAVSKRSANDQANHPVGLPVFTKNDALLHELVGQMTL